MTRISSSNYETIVGENLYRILISWGAGMGTAASIYSVVQGRMAGAIALGLVSLFVIVEAVYDTHKEAKDRSGNS